MDPNIFARKFEFHRPTYMPPVTTTTTTTTRKPAPVVKRDIAFDGDSQSIFPSYIIPWENIYNMMGQTIEIVLELSTHASEGLIMFQGSFGGSFFSLGSKY